MNKIRGVRLMDNQVAEIKTASGRVVLRVRIVPVDGDGPTVEVGMEPGSKRLTAGFDWSDLARDRLRIAAQ